MFIKLILKFKKRKKKKKVFKKDLTVCGNFESFTMQEKSKYCHNVHLPISLASFSVSFIPGLSKFRKCYLKSL